MKEPLLDTGYKDWLVELKQKVRSAQLKAAVAVNNEIILQHWESGKVIAEKEYTLDSKFLPQLEKVRSFVFPRLRGFLEPNLKYYRQFYQFQLLPFGQRPVAQLVQHSQTLAAELLNKDRSEQKAFSQHAVDQIPHRHNILIFTKSKDREEASPLLKRLKMN